MSSAQTLHMRLERLPHKVAVPLRELVATGHLPESDALSVLDAGDLAGEHGRLLAFAVAYLHMRSQGVPVHDVIAMANDQKRRVNLGWSAKRWKAEHERLSRAQALMRLAGDNVTYDVSSYERFLPDQYPGYLIRSSRRLGMEGLRQRHCVASYHPQLASGQSAIISLFVARKRWTVQLSQTGEAETPLRIVQIKTRFNELPSPAVRDQIHVLLGIPAPSQTGTPSAPAADAHSYLDTLRRLLPLLREHAVERVIVTFDGYGDSGSIEDLHYDGPDAFDATAVRLVRRIAAAQFDDGAWVRTEEFNEGSVNEAVEELTYDYLEETGIDWYNNDGGYGELVIDIARETVSLDVNVRYTDSNNEYCAETNILTGEDV